MEKRKTRSKEHGRKEDERKQGDARLYFIMQLQALDTERGDRGHSFRNQLECYQLGVGKGDSGKRIR